MIETAGKRRANFEERIYPSHQDAEELLRNENGGKLSKTGKTA